MGLFDFFKKKETKETPKPEKEEVEEVSQYVHKKQGGQ